MEHAEMMLRIRDILVLILKRSGRPGHATDGIEHTVWEESPWRVDLQSFKKQSPVIWRDATQSHSLRVWHDGGRVLDVRWDGHGEPEVLTFNSGSWVNDALALHRAPGVDSLDGSAASTA